MSEISRFVLGIIVFILTLIVCCMFLHLKEKTNELETRINNAIDYIENRNENTTLTRVQDIREQEILKILKEK